MPRENQRVDRLESWKEIAAYLKRDVRTVQRWEKDGLPIYRHPGKKRSTVYAFRAELDAWLVSTLTGPRKTIRSWPKSLGPWLAAGILLAAVVGLVSWSNGLLPNPLPVPEPISLRELLRSSELSEDRLNDPADSYVAIKSDGQALVYTDWMTGSLVVKHLPTGKAYSLYDITWDSPEMFTNPVLSRDDEKVAFVHHAGRAQFRVGIDSIKGGQPEFLDGIDAGSLQIHDWSPDGKLLLVARESVNGSIVLATIGLLDNRVRRLAFLDGSWPRRAEYSPDGRWVAFDAWKDGKSGIHLLDTQTLERRVLVNTPGEKDSPLWTKDGRFLLFRSSQSGEWDLHALAMKAGQSVGSSFLVKSNIGNDTSLRAITRDGELFYVEELSGSEIVVLERNTHTGEPGEVRKLPRIKGRSSIAPGLSPDGERLAYVTFVPQEPGGPRIATLHIVRLDGKLLKEAGFGRKFKMLYFPRFSPDGRRISLGARDSDHRTILLVLSAVTGDVVEKFAPSEAGQNYVFPATWSLDSQLVYVRKADPAKGKMDMEVLDLGTGERSEVTLPRDTAGLAFVSPDERYLALTLDDSSGQGDSKTNLVLLSMEDGTERALIRKDRFFPLVWDFDSSHVFYKKGSDRAENLYRLSVETGREELFLENARSLGWLDVSRDGRYLAFQKRSQDLRIWVLENLLPLTQNHSAH